MPDTTPRFFFRKSMRVVHGLDFDRVFRSGRVLSDSVLVIHAVQRDGEIRLGLSISKRVGNSPCRNRWKRLIREAFRLNRSRFPSGWDIVVRPRRGAQPNHQAIASSMLRLLGKLKK